MHNIRPTYSTSSIQATLAITEFSTYLGIQPNFWRRYILPRIGTPEATGSYKSIGFVIIKIFGVENISISDYVNFV